MEAELPGIGAHAAVTLYEQGVLFPWFRNSAPWTLREFCTMDS